MEKSLFIQPLMETFLAEFNERLHAMSRDLLALETSEAASAEREKRLQDLMRNAHSLKGAARAVDVKVVEESFHLLEDILTGVRRAPALLDQHLIQLLFSVLDGLAEAGKLLRKQESLDGSLLAGVSLEMEYFIESTLQPEAEQEASAPVAEGKPGRPNTPETVSTHPTPATAAAAPVAKAEPQAESPLSTPQEALTVRIDTEKLDVLLARSGELLAARQRIHMGVEQLAGFSDSLADLAADWRRNAKTAVRNGDTAATSGMPSARLQALHQQTPKRLQEMQAELNKLCLALREQWRHLDQAGAALDEQVSHIRMLPFSHCCVGFDRMVRDLARTSGKDVELRLEGGDVELDRSVLEGLKDPLRHLIRNAVDHGVEKPEERKRNRKHPRATIVASAALRGGQVEVTVTDDGQGLVAEAIRRRAQKLGLPPPDTERKLIEAVFQPGFSTAADAVSLVSGRGIGLDVVRSQIKMLHGEVDVSFTPGESCCFRLVVPLTLTLLRVLLVRAAQQIFAISNNYVYKLLRLRRSDVVWVGERSMILMDGKPIPLETLAHSLSLPQPPIRDWSGRLPVVVLRSEQRMVAFLVDELMAEQEVMVKSLGSRVQRIHNIAGAVVLPDGRVALTLHIADLLNMPAPIRTRGGSVLLPLQSDGSPEKQRRRILVVDDSVTTRSLERSMLESAGFLVELASDGVQGWERVQAGGIDLVLSDVDMPLLNGFQLTQTIRKSEHFRRLPVILITSNSDEFSRERGLAAGASAYMTKGEFDQNLLMNQIEQLL